MTFLVILISVLFQWFSGWGRILHRYDWFDYYWRGLRNILGKAPLWKGYGNLVFALLPLVLVVGFIQILLIGWLYNLLEILFGLIILLYCLKAYDMRGELKTFFQAYNEKDWHKAAAEASHFVGEAIKAEPKAIAQAMVKQLLLIAESRVFGVIFWFFLLGPVGAVLYYLTLELCSFAKEEDDTHGALKACAREFKRILDWLPQRFAALSFAIMGHFEASLKTLKALLLANLSESQRLYTEVGFESLHFETFVKSKGAGVIEETIRLLERSVIVWLIVMAMITLW